MNRPIHELLTILRDNCRVNNNQLRSGLCYELDNLEALDLITHSESMIFFEYIYKNMPTRLFETCFGKIEVSMYGWPRGEWPQRLEWLNEHILLTRQQSLSRNFGIESLNLESLNSMKKLNSLILAMIALSLLAGFALGVLFAIEFILYSI